MVVARAQTSAKILRGERGRNIDFLKYSNVLEEDRAHWLIYVTSSQTVTGFFSTLHGHLLLLYDVARDRSRVHVPLVNKVRYAS
jgi:hypothetical protein